MKTLLYIDTQMDFLTVYKIKQAVADYFDIDVAVLDDPYRSQPVCTYRQIAMYFSKVYSNNSNAFIADLFNGRSHKSVANSIETIDKLIGYDVKFRDLMFDVKGAIEVKLQIEL